MNGSNVLNPTAQPIKSAQIGNVYPLKLVISMFAIMKMNTAYKDKEIWRKKKGNFFT